MFVSNRVSFNAGTGSTAAGYWGDYECDVPYHTLENMMESIVARKDEVHISHSQLTQYLPSCLQFLDICHYQVCILSLNTSLQYKAFGGNNLASLCYISLRMNDLYILWMERVLAVSFK